MRLEFSLDGQWPGLDERRLQRFNESVNRHTFCAIAHIEQFTKFDNFLIGEFGIVLAKQVFELSGVNFAIVILIGVIEVGFDGLNYRRVEYKLRLLLLGITVIEISLKELGLDGLLNQWQREGGVMGEGEALSSLLQTGGTGAVAATLDVIDED